MSRWLRWLLYVLGALLALIALAWVAVPPLLKHQVEEMASEQLGRRLSFGSIDFKPWTLELELRDVVLGSADLPAGGASANSAASAAISRGEQLRIGRAYVNAELQSLLRLAPVIDSVQIEGVRGSVVHFGAGKYDFDDILAKIATLPKSDKTSEQPPQFAIYNIALKDVALSLDDRPAGKTHQLTDLQLSLPFLSTLEAERSIKTQPRLAFVLNGSRFDSAGETTPFIQTRKTDAKVTIRALDLAPYLPYLPAGLPFKLTSAVLGADITVAFEQTPKPTVRLSGKLQADRVAVQDAAERPLLALQNVSVTARDVQPLLGKVDIESITLQAPQLQLRRDATGQLNLLAAPKSAALRTSPNTTKTIAPRADSMPASTPKDSKNATPTATPTPWQISMDRVSLVGGSVTWADETTQPVAALAARDIHLEATQIAWPFAADKPMAFNGSSQVAQGSLTFSGTATDVRVSISAQLSGLPLASFAPYLSGVLAPALNGVADAQGSILWQSGQSGQNGQKEALQITLTKAQLANLQLTNKSQAGGKVPLKTPLAQIKLLSLESGQIDVLAQTVKLAKISASGVQSRVARNEQGRWMAQDWLISSAASPNSVKNARANDGITAPTVAKNASASKPWKVALGEINLDAPKLAFVDQAPAAGSSRVVQLNVDGLKAKLLGLELEGDQFAAKPMPLSLSASLTQADEDGKPLGEPAKIDLQGQVAPAPLALQLQAKITRLPIHAFEPYFADALNIDVLRLEAGFSGTVQMAQSPQGLQLKVVGDALAEELQTTLRGAALAAASGGVAGDELLNWKALGARALSIEMTPGAALKIDVGEAALTDFFARVLISEQGRINLADILKSGGTSESARTGTTATINSVAPRADNTPATGQNDSKNTPSSSPEPIINMGAISLINGKVYFADRFIKPNYAANLSELNGKLGAFSSQPVAGTVQMAELQLRGKAEGTAALEIIGQLNPLAKPLALNITGKVRDLELAPLSPYSVKYSGHGIERGKMSVDVKYRIQPDGALTASNQIVLNQIKFGDKVEGAPNSLPVRLAVALLSDRNGVIDINLPIQGSLNDPQFSVGPIIFKLIVNLVVKALTSPFSLLASAFGGGGDELSQVAFQSGSAQIAESAKPGMEKVVKALLDRPTLKMTVIGQASIDIEREAFKQERLKALVLAEKRRTTVASGAASPATQTAAITVSEAEYPALLKEVYKRSDVPKPRNAVGFVKELPVAEMEALLLANLPVTEQAIQELALARGVAVRDYLAAKGLPTDRLFLGAGKAVGREEKWSPRAELSLASP